MRKKRRDLKGRGAKAMEVVRGVRREYPHSPIVGVGGIIFHEEQVLLAQRGQDPGKGVWTLPGGVVELGECLEEALKREILEELALAIRVCGLVRLLDRIIRDEAGKVRYHYVIADYWGYSGSGQLRPGSDVTDARYVNLGDLHGLGLQKEVVETILMAVRMRQQIQVSRRIPL